jgi:hypothetical protein
MRPIRTAGKPRKLRRGYPGSFRPLAIASLNWKVTSTLSVIAPSVLAGRLRPLAHLFALESLPAIKPRLQRGYSPQQ